MRSKNVHECSVVTSHNNSAHSAAGADKVELRPVKDESVLFMATVQKLNPTDLSKDISLLSLSIVTLLPTSGGKNLMMAMYLSIFFQTVLFSGVI